MQSKIEVKYILGNLPQRIDLSKTKKYFILNVNSLHDINKFIFEYMPDSNHVVLLWSIKFRTMGVPFLADPENESPFKFSDSKLLE